MKYFIDTEFIEGKQKYSLFAKNTIELISIGIVSEEDKVNGMEYCRHYYAISKDFNIKEAWNRYDLEVSEEIGAEQTKVYWLRDNVLKPIWKELLAIEYNEIGGFENHKPVYSNEDFTYREVKRLIKKYGKTTEEIAKEIEEFCKPKTNRTSPEFYSYFADYDWVVFCWLFGKMIDLPKDFPKYCRDLKQTLDDKANSFTSMELSKLVHPDCEHNVFELLGNPEFNLTNLGCLKSHKDYPKQNNEHHALSDARWNYELYKFLNKV